MCRNKQDLRKLREAAIYFCRRYDWTVHVYFFGNLIVGARFPRPIAKSYTRNFRRDKVLHNGHSLIEITGELMKNLNLFPLLIIFASLLSLSNSSAQEYTRWNLPQGAIARLGKGKINQVKYSPDGNTIAVASSIGFGSTTRTPVRN